MSNATIISAISNIRLYQLRCSLVEGVPEQNAHHLAKTAKAALEQARLMSLELINRAIGWSKVTEDTIMLSWNWHHKRVPEIFRESCYDIWFKKIDDDNIIDLLDYYIEYGNNNTKYNVKADAQIVRAIYQAIKNSQRFFKDYDRIKAVIEFSNR